MTAPAEIRSVTGELATSLPGVTFGTTFPRLARLANRMAIVRSFTHGNSNHTGGAQDVMRGGTGNQVGMGSIVTRLRGTNHPRTGPAEKRCQFCFSNRNKIVLRSLRTSK